MGLAMLTWTITVLFISWEDFLLTLALALVPSWNKSLLIGLLYSIFHEFKASSSRTIRVVRYLSIVSTFLSVYVGVLSIGCAFSWLFWILAWFGGPENVVYSSIWMLFLSIVLTPFYNFFFVMWNQLRPKFKYKYYMICVPCCCGCFCTDQWLTRCVPRRCRGHFEIRDTTWLIVGMAFVWIVCTVVLNDNECLAESALIEYAFGFRGAATLVLMFSVFINIELTYNGEVKHRNRRVHDPRNLQRNPAVSGNGNAPNAVEEQEVPPVEVDLSANQTQENTQENQPVQSNGIEEADKVTVR